MWTVCIQSGHATSRGTSPGVRIPKCVGGRGRSTVPIEVQISCRRMIKIMNMIFFSLKDNSKFIFNHF